MYIPAGQESSKLADPCEESRSTLQRNDEATGTTHRSNSSASQQAPQNPAHPTLSPAVHAQNESSFEAPSKHGEPTTALRPCRSGRRELSHQAGQSSPGALLDSAGARLAQADNCPPRDQRRSSSRPQRLTDFPRATAPPPAHPATLFGYHAPLPDNGASATTRPPEVARRSRSDSPER
jgi:hypothetical protein